MGTSARERRSREKEKLDYPIVEEGSWHRIKERTMVEVETRKRTLAESFAACNGRENPRKLGPVALWFSWKLSVGLGLRAPRRWCIPIRLMGACRTRLRNEEG